VKTVGENPGPALPTCACQLTTADADGFNSGNGPGLFGSISQRIDGAGMVGIHSFMVAQPESASADTTSADIANADGTDLFTTDMRKRSVIASSRPVRVASLQPMVRAQQAASPRPPADLPTEAPRRPALAARRRPVIPVSPQRSW